MRARFTCGQKLRIPVIVESRGWLKDKIEIVYRHERAARSARTAYA